MNRGKIIIILCAILLSIQIASADILNLTASTNETFADNRTVRITANLTNTTGYPINNTRVNFTTDCGILSAGYNYTNASGIATANISSWDLCTAKITAQAPNATNVTVNITFVRGPISRIILSANSSDTVNTTHLVTATVYDKTRDEFANNESRWRVMPNVPLNFTITPPPNNTANTPITYNSANVTPSTNTTDTSGITTAIARIDKRAGSNDIWVNVTNEDGVLVYNYITIIGIAGEATTLAVTASPENVSANGIELSHVTGKVTDEFGNPLLSTGAIRFNITGSDPIIKPLNSVGEATISIGPSKFTCSVAVNGTYINVTGDYTNLTDSATVIFYEEEPVRVVVTADATKISTSNIPGANISTITATVIDKWGHTLPGRTVNFSLTGPGTLSSPTKTTDSHGQVTITLQSDTAGDATVAAKALNDSGYELEGSIVIRIVDKPFISVITTIEPDPVEPGGIINVTTSVSGQGNITGMRLAAHAMLTLDRSGSMDPDYYAGTPLDVALVLDRSGSMEYLGSNPEQPMTDAKTAAKVFMDNLVSNAQVGVVSFSSDHRVDIGLTLLNSSDDKALVRNAIDGISATGGTAIGDGLADANNMLIGGRVDARKITVLLTDGVCNSGSDQDCSNAISVANTNHITIYTIGLGSAEYIDEPLLQRVASETGGRYYNAPSSSELRAVYNSIAQEISDYDITEIEYGTEGFTPYNYETEGSLSPINTSPPYILRFGGYDLDYIGDCRIEVNGVVLTSIPPPYSANNDWKDDYEYDITALVQNGTNVISFYDPNDYTNAIRNVVILANNITIAQYPTEVNLVDDYPYNCTFNTSYYSFEDTFLINETINDLKVLVDWENTTTDLNLRLTSPSGHVYGAGDDTTGYYFDDREAVPIDARSPEFDTYIASASPNTVFAGETSFYVTDKLTAGGEKRCSIMRWKLPGAPTHNARIESVTMYLRGITPDDNPWGEHRSINIYDLTTSYSGDPTWNCRDNSASQAWASGSFSSADNDSYLIGSVALTSSITDDVVEFNITSANWSGSRLPDWDESCNIVLTGSGYDGEGADRFASSETNPNDHTYRLNGYRPLVTITYSIPRDTSEYIWIHPLPYTYPATDADMVENGNWTVQVTGSGAGVEQFNITTYIDKKSAAKLASHAFISSLDPTREDRVGLATYSYSSTNDTANQTSYVCEGNQWEGYFTVDTQGIYYFNLSWANASDNLDLYLYDGITVLNSSVTGSSPEMVSATLSPGTNYRIVINGTNVIGSDTQFAINVYSTIETVNSGTAAFLGASTTVDIPSVDLNKTFLIVKSSNDRTGSSNANAFTIRGHFIDNDTIEFTRASSSGEGKVSYFVIQSDNIEVQSGTTTFANGDSQKDVPITSVTDNTTKCFVTLSTSSNSNSRKYVHESWVTGELTTNNNLRLKRTAFGNSQVTVDWFVIHFTDNTTVQTGEKSWSGVQATQAITSVNTSRTWIYFTSRMNNNGLAHTSIKGEITDSTTLTFSKHSGSTTGTDYVRYFVIEFPEDSGVAVQRGTASVSSGDSTVDIGITAVNREMAFAFVTNDCKGTGTAYARPYWISYFTADNNLKMQRWYTGQPVVHKWQVVEWTEGASVETADTPVNWLEWRAQIDNSLDDSIVSFNPINASIDALTADGMTAIDEGLYEANNALCEYFGSKPINNGTIVLMTDGIDNVGYHSMIAEAERAAANNTTIFTVGFGSTIDDRVLRQIANITGGEYYFAPNATVLKNIFVGIAGELGNFTAPEPRIDIRIGNNSTIEGAFANVTYINNSANVTYFYCTCKDCSEGHYGYEHPSNPNVTYIGNRTILSWDIGNRPDRIITVGKYWNVTYQLRIDNESAGYVPIILYPSCVTYEGAGGEGNCSNNLIPDVNVDVVGNDTNSSTKPAHSIELTNKAVSGGPPTRKPYPHPDTVQEYAYRLTASLKDDGESPVAFGAVVEFKATSGTLYSNDTNHNTSGLLNETTGLGGAAIVWLSSDVPGTITVCAYHTTASGTELTPACNVVIFHSLESPPIIPPAPRPRGVITLESDPFMTDWLSLLRRSR